MSPDRFRAITESALEGLARKELNLSAIVGRSAEAKERRLVPEVVEQFFVAAAPETGLRPRNLSPKESDVYQRRQDAAQSASRRRPSGITLRTTWPRLRQDRLRQDAAAFRSDAGMGNARASAFRGRSDAICLHVSKTTCSGEQCSSISIGTAQPLLDIFAASIKDGRGNAIHRRLFAVETAATGEMRSPRADHSARCRPGAGRHARHPSNGFVLPDRQRGASSSSTNTRYNPG